MSKVLDAKRSTLTIKIPWTTYATGVFVVLVGYSLFILWPLLKVIALSVLVAAALHPIVGMLQRRGLGPISARSVVIFCTLFGLAIFGYLVVPDLFEQLGRLSQRYPEVRDRVLRYLPDGGYVKRYIAHYALGAETGGMSKWYDQINWAGGKFFALFWDFLVFLAMTCYLLVDGSKLYEWFAAFFPEQTQAKIDATAVEGSDLIFAYVAGQAVTSALVTVYSYIVLKILGVPAAIVLACLAGIFDIFPVVGFFLSAGPATLLALAISPLTALVTAGCYLAYHLLETYFIVPRIYGQKLRLSTFTVLISLLIGWELAGIPGAILSLPLAASYSVIERIWLTAYLHRKVIMEHEEQKAEAFGEKPPAVAAERAA